jgi:hypothetical protein
MVARVERFLAADNTQLLAFSRLASWFPPDVEKLMQAKDQADFAEIFEEYSALKTNMQNFSAAERIKRVMTDGVLDFALERCDLDADGIMDLMIQDDRGLVFFFAGNGAEPQAAMHAPVMSSTEEDMTGMPSEPENVAARMKYSPEDGCLYLGYEPNSGAISCFRFVDGKLVEDVESMESSEP